MFGHIDAWRSSGKSQKVYCKEVGLSLAVLGYWITKQRKATRDVAHTNTDRKISSVFIPVSVQENRAVDQIELVYPNGVRLLLNSTEKLDQIAALIKLI